jgi:lauroyl/myristoyl acyltransferase
VLSAHRGNGWWTLAILARQGKAVELVSAPFPPLKTLREKFWWPYLRLRWREMNRMGGAPLITMKGASKHVRDALANRGRVIATIDIPPALARRCGAVQFFGRDAYMPRQAIDIAVETGAPLWMFFGDIDAASLTQRIRFERIDTTGGAQAAFQDYAERVEAAIRNRPGSWHAWGDVELYFDAPITDATASRASD